MIKDIVNIIGNLCLRHKNVRTFRYQSRILNNAQNGYETFQCYLDDVSHHELNITTNIFKVEFTLWVLAQPTEEPDSILDIQDKAYTIGVDILGALDNMEEYAGILSVYDYDIMTVAHYSDDDSAGIRMSFVLSVPSPLNLCTLEDQFNPEPYSGETDTQITVEEKEIGNLDFKTIKLPKSPSRC